MASLVESTAELLAGDAERLRYISFSEAMTAAEEFASPLYDLHEETWQELYLRPSPPVSPDCLSPADSTPVPEDVSEGGDLTEALLSNIMEYEQIMDTLKEAELALCNSQQDLLIQDCMWSGGLSCENTKKYTLGDNYELTDPTTVVSSTPNNTESDCVEPSVVFPNLRNDATLNKPPPSKIVSNVRPARPSSSESEEEIDVVTVEHHRTVSGHHKIDLPPRRHTQPPQTITIKPTPATQLKNVKKTSTNSSRNSSPANSPGKATQRKKRLAKRHGRIGSQDGTESDEEARRASHNVLERKRRNDLKNSFDVLRMGIPELEENVRAPKVVILRKAVEYIQVLQCCERKSETDLIREQKRYNKLRERLAYLRNMPATL